jgi:AcrR family transcriptional regulator
MPARPRTSREAIVAAASALLEADGIEAVTMSAVAERVGVRGPSLYKHVDGWGALIRAVASQVTADLSEAIEGATASRREPRAGIRAAAVAYRRFVHAHPNGYGLLFAHLAPDWLPPSDAIAAVGRPLVGAMEKLVGPDRALEAARTLAAWAHGFVSMELAGAFRLGGDVDAAFAYGIEAVLAGVSGASERVGRGRRGAASR